MVACHMTSELHVPVLLEEAIAALVTRPDGLYIDATFGRGSHSRAILSRLNTQGRLLALDRDPSAIAFANETIHDPRFHIEHARFSDLEHVAKQVFGDALFSGILFDLGVSSPQLDMASRGFSFMQEGPLDMRMDPSCGIDAATWLQTVSEAELAHVLFTYGEERYARRIAKQIVEARAGEPIHTTRALANLVKSAVPAFYRHGDIHPATRTFQAIRIAINGELQEIETALPQALTLLAPLGRLAVISFHSLEDRIVKTFIKQQEKGDELPRYLPITKSFTPKLRALGKAIKPSALEIRGNPRARSAILRVAEKQL